MRSWRVEDDGNGETAAWLRLDGARLRHRASVAVCATVLVSLYASFVLLLVRGQADIQHSDFLVYFSASQLVFHGHGGATYDFATFKSVESTMFHVLLHVRNEAVFLYPPFVALALAPLAALSYTGAYVLWTGINAVLLVGVLLAYRRYLRLPPSEFFLFAAAAASFFPVFASVAEGQVSLVILAFLSASFLALRSKRDLLAGGLLALLLLKPPYLLPFVLVLLVQRRWRMLGSFGVTAALLTLLPMIVLGPSINLDYLRLLKEASAWHTTSGGFSPLANQNLAGQLHLILAPSMATALQILFSLIALAPVYVVASRTRLPDLPFAVATIAALLVNPHVLIHDLSLLVLPAAVAVRHASAGKRSLVAVLGTGYLTALVGIPVSSALHLQLPVFAMIALLVWLTVAAVRPLPEAPRAHRPGEREQAGLEQELSAATP